MFQTSPVLLEGKMFCRISFTNNSDLKILLFRCLNTSHSPVDCSLVMRLEKYSHNVETIDW